MGKTPIETRNAYGDAIIELAEKDKDIITMDCDLGASTRASWIQEVDPDRFIEMGISEQDMISTAAGLAKMGKTVFANSFAIFITGRGFDQIRQQVALPKANVKICGSSAGLTQGPDGATHQSLLDVSLMRSLPNMTVYVPGDAEQTRNVVIAAADYKGPVYIRLSRFPVETFSEGHPFESGKAQIIEKGKDVLLCSTGPITGEVVKACNNLRNMGIEPTLAVFHTIKPFDTDKFIELASELKTVITIEEHSIIGGLGSIAAETLAENSVKFDKFHRIGVNDHFGESGTAQELLNKYKLDADGITEQIASALKEG
jgi:transketolase